MASNQHYVQSHPKKITIWGTSSPDDVNESFATWIYLGEFNSFKPSGLPTGQVSQADTDYARAGEEFFITDNTDVPVRYLRFHVLETWVTPNSTIQIMELEFFGIID